MTTKPTNPEPPEPKVDKATEKAAAEVQEAFDVANAQGFFGTKVDPLPNEAYSLESGPDSPTVEDVRAAVAKANSK